jgi:cytochrome c-type biogenesis protein CcmE
MTDLTNNRTDNLGSNPTNNLGSNRTAAQFDDADLISSVDSVPLADTTQHNTTRNSVAPNDDLGEIDTPAPANKRKNLRAYLSIGLVALGLGVVLVKGLGSATSYFLQADEAVQRMGSLNEKPFRLLGAVVENSVKQTEKRWDFDVEFNGATVHVQYEKEPPELFKAGLAVVVAGRFAPNQSTRPANEIPLFLGDQIAVKHTNDYIEKKADRLKGAVDDPTASTASPNTSKDKSKNANAGASAAKP